MASVVASVPGCAMSVLSRDCLSLVLAQFGNADLARACRVHSVWHEVARPMLVERKTVLQKVADATTSEKMLDLLSNPLVWREDVCPGFAEKAQVVLVQHAYRLRAICRSDPSREIHLALISFCARVLERIQGRKLWNLETSLWRYMSSSDARNLLHYESSLRQAMSDGRPDDIIYCVQMGHFLRDMDRIDELKEFAQQSVERFSSENLGPSLLMEVLETYTKDPTSKF